MKATNVARVGYVLRRAPPLRIATDCERPRFEFERFCERNRATIVPLADPREKSGPISCAARRLGVLGKSVDLLLNNAGGFDAYVTTGEDIGIPLALAARVLRHRTPIHILFHGHHVGSSKFAFAMNALRGARFIHWHPLSASLRRLLIGRFQVAPAQCHATGYAVDTAFFQPVSRPASVIASAGTAYRDYRTLVAASRGLDIPVKIAADSTWFPADIDLGEAAQASGIEARSYGNYANLRDLYATARFVVVPLQPREHACGYAVIAEAMAMGKAVIATRTSAPSDFVIEGETGYFVDPSDVAGMHRRMRLLLDDHDLAAELGLRARARMANFTLDAFCMRMETAIAASV